MSLLLATMLLLQDKTAEQLIDKLRSDKVEEREEAARKLKEMGKAALPELEKARGDKDPEVASRARYLVEVAALREKLSPYLRNVLPGVEDRLAAGGHAWTEVLLEVMRKDKKGERKYPDLQKDDLNHLAGPGVREATPKEKLEICQFLERDVLAKETAPNILKLLLKDRSAEVRSKAAHALGELGAKNAAPEVAKLLEDEIAGVRSSAAWALGKLGAKETTPGIAKLLKDGDAGVRTMAVRALGKLGAKEIAPEIVKLLQDEEADVRSRAAEALGSLGVNETALEIVKLLKDKDAGVRGWAAAALGRLGGKETVPEIVKLLWDGDANVRSWAGHVLGSLGAKETAPEIVKLLKDKDEHVRLMTASVLEDLGAKECAPEILKLLKDGDANVRYLSVRVLGRLGAREAAPDIAKLLRDGDPRVRSMAASSLCGFGLREGVPVLLEESKALPVRLSALNVLRRKEVWERLAKKALGRDLQGTIHQIAETLERESGLRMVFPAKEELDASMTYWIGRRGGQESLFETLGQVLDLADGNHEIILESDCIRIVSREEAIKFWTAWWLKEGKQ
jgi:HEAT repeat protein